MERKQFIRGIIGFGLVTIGCSRPRPTPIPTLPSQALETPLPLLTPRPDIIDPKIEELARRDILKLDNYPLALRQKMTNFWLLGVTTTLEYTKDGKSYLFNVNPAKPDLQLNDFANTAITLGRRRLSTGGSALTFSLSGSYWPNLGEGLPELTKNKIRAMNFEHEAIVSIAYINGLIKTGIALRLDFTYPSQPTPREPQLLSDVIRYISTLSSYAEAVAETNDYLSTYPLLDKDPQTGQVLFSNYPDSQNPQPLINGKVFLERGSTFIVDQTIGPSLKGISSLDQLAQKYPSVENIPGSLEYLRRIKQHFKN